MPKHLSTGGRLIVFGGYQKKKYLEWIKYIRLKDNIMLSILSRMEEHGFVSADYRIRGSALHYGEGFPEGMLMVV
ncbi:unnamed protein product [Urochloa humidicola]